VLRQLFRWDRTTHLGNIIGHTDPMNVSDLWPLSKSFEYAAEVGLALRTQHPDWWNDFANDADLSRWPLAQAQGLVFLTWLESWPESNPEQATVLLAAVEQALGLCAGRVRVELEASLACIGRDYTARQDPDPLPELVGETVIVAAPTACRGYPEQTTAELDQWTERALAGAEVEWLDTEPATHQQLLRVHDGNYLAGLAGLAKAGGGLLSPETWVTRTSEPAYLAGSGALVSVTQQARKHRDHQLRLCWVRPGSHHAERARGGGTCLINHVAVAAAEALRTGARSIAILDVDAHHGQGTEQIFYDQPQVLTVSCHQANPFFPGTGHARDVGSQAGYRKNLNIPVRVGDSWRSGLEQALSAVRRHHPDLVLVEYSTDAHRADPVSDLNGCDGDYFWLGQQLQRLGAPVVCELGASLSERAWVGGIRSLIRGWHASPLPGVT
jgi:acetoin utilization deacetylase AcuC-like enzyme